MGDFADTSFFLFLHFEAIPSSIQFNSTLVGSMASPSVL